jgi:hypothetical protein
LLLCNLHIVVAMQIYQVSLLVGMWENERCHASIIMYLAVSCIKVIDMYLFNVAGAKWSHQTYHRQWYPVSSIRNCWNKCQVWIMHIWWYFVTSWRIWKSCQLRFFYECLKHLLIYDCSTTYITCPADPKKTLGIKLPFLVMIIKNLKKYFTFEVQVSFLTSLASDCLWITFSNFSIFVNLEFVIGCFVLF